MTLDDFVASFSHDRKHISEVEGTLPRGLDCSAYCAGYVECLSDVAQFVFCPQIGAELGVSDVELIPAAIMALIANIRGGILDHPNSEVKAKEDARWELPKA